MSISYDEFGRIRDAYIVTYNMVSLILNNLFRDVGTRDGSKTHPLPVKLDHTGLEYTLRPQGEQVKERDCTH